MYSLLKGDQNKAEPFNRDWSEASVYMSLKDFEYNNSKWGRNALCVYV